MFTGLSLLALIVCYGLYRLACEIGEAPLIGEDHPQALSRLDRLERDGLAKFKESDDA